MILLLKTLFKKIPYQLWILAGGIVAFWGWGEYRYYEGKDEVQSAWDKSVERGKVIVEYLEEQADAITIVKEIEYQERERIIYEEGKTVVKEIPIYIPDPTILFPGGFRLLHDAAADGTSPNSLELDDAAPVPIRVATETITENYTDCRATAARLISWQDWWVEQCQLRQSLLPQKKRVQCLQPWSSDS